MLMQAIDSYLAVRRAGGFDLFEREGFLRSFATFASERGETHVRTQSAIDWARLGSSPPQWDRRIKEVIRFARHVHAEDPRHHIPAQAIFGHFPRPQRTPFIYSDADLRRLIEEAFRLMPLGSIRPQTYGTLFSLLAATGLRISEAIALRLDSVSKDGLVIRNTKFRKSRLVPLHPTAEAGIERFLVHRRTVGGTATEVFVTEGGCPLRYRTVCGVFHRLLLKIGLRPRPGAPNPRIHDLRHRFAVRALETCPSGRERIHQHMLALSTYLGHANIADTYWYLRATPQLLLDLAQASESFAEGAAR